MYTSENIQEFAQQLAESKPSTIFSMLGTHSVEYMDSSAGPVALIDMTLPPGMSVQLANGQTGNGTIKVGIVLPEGE